MTIRMFFCSYDCVCVCVGGVYRTPQPTRPRRYCINRLKAPSLIDTVSALQSANEFSSVTEHFFMAVIPSSEAASLSLSLSLEVFHK